MQPDELTPQELRDALTTPMFQAGIAHEYGWRDWWYEASGTAIPPARRSNNASPSKFASLLLSQSVSSESFLYASVLGHCAKIM